MLIYLRNKSGRDNHNAENRLSSSQVRYAQDQHEFKNTHTHKHTHTHTHTKINTMSSTIYSVKIRHNHFKAFISKLKDNLINKREIISIL